MTEAGARIRPMVGEDLAEVAAVTGAAFRALAPGPAEPDGSDEPIFPALLFRVRLESDPAGCLVALEPDGDRVGGALFSVARGSLGWFGPLAVRPDLQRAGVGRQLVEACVAGWQERGVRLMGLETMADSPFHVRFYATLGFRPAWTGVAFSRTLGRTTMPARVERGGPLPDLSFVYPGLDVGAETTATAACGAGVTLVTGDGLAICHLEPTFQEPGTGFVPFLAAESRRSFDALLDAAEHLSAKAGCTALRTRVSGSASATMDALVARGYRAGGVMVRMKAGELLDYDRDAGFYCDNWL